MTIEEKSKEYAKGKALDALTAAIEQAYIDGFNDGLRHLENERLEAIKDGVVYKELNLKLSKRWSSEYIRDKQGIRIMTYNDVSTLNLPTKEQFEELCSECVPEYVNTTNFHGIQFSGTNGKSIRMEYYDKDYISFLTKPNKDTLFNIWIKDDGDSNEKLSANVKIENGRAIPVFEKVYMGLKLPVMLVENE